MSTYQPETHALYRETSETGTQLVQLVVLTATLLAQRAVEERERRYAMEQAAAEERARAAAEQLRAQRAAAEPVLRAVHQERFWKNPDPKRIGRAWQAASEWAEGDPYAAYTLEFLREQLKERFNITAPAWPVGGAELSRIVTMANPQYRRYLTAAREAAEETQSVSYAVIIRDTQDPYTILYQGHTVVPAGMPAATAAAREFETWLNGTGADKVKGRELGEFTIEAMENTEADRSAHVPAAEVRGYEVGEVLATDEAWQRALVEGTERGTPAEMLYALGGELERLEEEERRRLARRAEYVARLNETDLSDADRKRLTGNVTAIDEGLKGLHQQQADSALNLAATAAELRGENPAQVFQTARLRESLDEEWWATASAAEVSGVWAHVAKWEPGQAQDEMLESLRGDIERHHHLLIPRDASADMVAAVFGGREAPGAATPISERAQVLRDQAQAIHESAFDLYAEAATVLDRAEQLEGEEHEQAVGLAGSLRERAEAETAVAGRLVEQATWLEAQTPEVMSRLYAENSDDALRSLTERFEQQWGQPLGSQVQQDLGAVAEDLAQGRSPWTVVADAGSANPAALPDALAVAAKPQDRNEKQGGPEIPLALPPEDEALLHRELEQRQAADAALTGLDDAELAEAVRVTQQAFPEGAEAATAVAPASRAGKGGGMPETARQKAPTLER